MSSGNEFNILNWKFTLKTFKPNTAKTTSKTIAIVLGFRVTTRATLLHKVGLSLDASPTFGTFGQNDGRPNSWNNAGISVSDATMTITIVVANIGANN